MKNLFKKISVILIIFNLSLISVSFLHFLTKDTETQKPASLPEEFQEIKKGDCLKVVSVSDSIYVEFQN